jgi:hypothetical protein
VQDLDVAEALFRCLDGHAGHACLPSLRGR